MRKHNTKVSFIQASHSVAGLFSGKNMNPAVKNHKTPGLTVHTGWCHAGSFQQLFEQADSAMYSAKKKGKNGFEVADGTVTEQITHEARKIEPHEMIGPEDQKFIAYAD